MRDTTGQSRKPCDSLAILILSTHVSQTTGLKLSESTRALRCYGLSGRCSLGMMDGLCCWSAPIATRRACTSTGGNGIVTRAGQTVSGKSVGSAVLAPGCATLPKAAIFVPHISAGLGSSASCLPLSETCHVPSPGFHSSLRPSMILVRLPDIDLQGLSLAISV
jgi:hypothetical protein